MLCILASAHKQSILGMDLSVNSGSWFCTCSFMVILFLVQQYGVLGFHTQHVNSVQLTLQLFNWVATFLNKRSVPENVFPLALSISRTFCLQTDWIPLSPYPAVGQVPREQLLYTCPIPCSSSVSSITEHSSRLPLVLRPRGEDKGSRPPTHSSISIDWEL